MTTYLKEENNLTDDVICNKCEEINSFTNNNCSNCGAKLNDNNEPKAQTGLINFLLLVGKNIRDSAVRNLYLILLFVSLFYFLLYLTLRYGIKVEGLDSPLFEIINNIALLVFSAGIFTSSLKYLQYLKVFEKEFQRIILSDQYNDRIKKNIESITLSEEFFLKQNDIESIWQTVTLSKYKKEFPEIYNDIKSKLSNELFEKSNIEYYYKNVNKTYTVTLEQNDVINIVEETMYTIVRKTKEKFKWDCSLKVYEEDSFDKKFPKIEFKILDEQNSVIDQSKDIEGVSEGKYFIRKIDKILSGNKEYTINRTVVLKQNLHRDREFSFGSSRIIDDLTVSLRYSSDLKVIFSEIRKVKFHKEKSIDLGKYTEDLYINRGILLPGEKFKLFFIKTT